jgi:gamma-glutamyl phosphate reductase
MSQIPKVNDGGGFLALFIDNESNSTHAYRLANEARNQRNPNVSMREIGFGH